MSFAQVNSAYLRKTQLPQYSTSCDTPFTINSIAPCADFMPANCSKRLKNRRKTSLECRGTALMRFQMRLLQMLSRMAGLMNTLAALCKCFYPQKLFRRWHAQHSPLVMRRHVSQPAHCSARSHAKPAWVKQRILRLKILLPADTGVRKIAATFNRSQATHKKQSSIRVSKTYVANILRANQLALRDIRNHMLKQAPGISKINQTWGIDLTGKQDTQGQLHYILGVIDHGSRKMLSLLVSSKHSLQLAEHLQDPIAQHGKPKRIRTDNERCFTSPSFSHCLQASSIHHQRIDLHCPWQNGRIERLFGTLKQELNQIHIQSAEHLQNLLDEFKHWYNTIRLHQHLGYQTPQEVWQQQKPSNIKRNAEKAQPIWWTGWSGQLSGMQWSC